MNIKNIFSYTVIYFTFVGLLIFINYNIFVSFGIIDNPVKTSIVGFIIGFIMGAIIHHGIMPTVKKYHEKE